jgi:Family of unknown function (DUF6535)
MLEPDQTEILVDIAIQYLNGIGNQSRNLTRPNFEPSFEAISVNCLLFASLGASLVAALASVVALQWVADYDATITRGGSSPEDRAKRRQFRHAGVIGWKMGEIIAALPILLYASVVLFWAGAIQWVWTLHHTVGYVVAGGTAIAVLFYASTTILAAVYVSAPFHTPLSRGLYWAIGPSASTIRRLVSWIPFKIILRRVAVPSGAARLPSLFRNSAAMQWIAKHFLPGRTSRYREDQAAEQDPSVASDALAWLAQQLPISADSHERLLLCISGILGLSTENPPSPRFYTTPWLTILNFLSKHFMTQIIDRNSSNHDYQGVGILMQCIDSPFIRSNVVPDVSYIRNPREAEYWGQCCLVKDGTLHLGTMRQVPMAFLLARDVPVPSPGSKHELEATWKLIKWRNSISVTGLRFNRKLRTYDIWPEIFGDIGGYSPEFFEACLCHFRVWTTIPRYCFPSGAPDYAVMFDSVVEQALHRGLSINELLALVRAFAGYLSASQSRETVDETNIVRQPLSYALAVGRSSEATRARHLTITLLVVQVARLLVRTEALRWARWIALMFWIAIPKDSGYLDALWNSIIERTSKVWEEIETSSTSVAIQGPHVAEVARILWRVDNGMMESLSRDTFKEPQSLVSSFFLFQVPLTPHRDIWNVCFKWFLIVTPIAPARNIYCSTSMDL